MSEFTNFSNFFQKNNTNTDVKIWLDVYEDFYSILSNIVLHNNLNLKYGIYITPSFDTLINDNFFKDQISTNLCNSFIELYNDDQNIFNSGYYLTFKENLDYPDDYLIIFFRPLLKYLKSLINQDIFNINLDNELEINDFVQTYIISILLYNNNVIDQLDYLRDPTRDQINNNRMALYAILNQESYQIIIDNAYNTQMYYLYNQDYISKKYLQENNISSPIKNYQKLLLPVTTKFNRDSKIPCVEDLPDNNIDNISKLKYYLFETASNFIQSNFLLKENEYEFVLNAYNHFTNNDTKDTTFYYNSYIINTTDNNEDSHIILEIYPSEVKFNNITL